MENKRKVEFKYSYRIRTNSADELDAFSILKRFNEFSAVKGKIGACYQFENNKTWIIGFKEDIGEPEKAFFNKNCYCRININNKLYFLENANDVVSIFRIGWLPHNADCYRLSRELFANT